MNSLIDVFPVRSSMSASIAPLPTFLTAARIASSVRADRHEIDAGFVDIRPGCSRPSRRILAKDVQLVGVVHIISHGCGEELDRFRLEMPMCAYA